MTAPRWLREQRRAQASLGRSLAQLPFTLDFVTKQVITLRMQAAGLAGQVDRMHDLASVQR